MRARALVPAAALALGALLAPIGAEAAQRSSEPADAGAALVELRLEGPLEGLLLDEGGRTTRVEGELAAGERRTLTAPLTLWSPWRGAGEVLGRLALRALPEGAAGAGAVLSVSAPRPDLWSSGLAPSLTLRSRPPLEPAAPAPGAVRLLLVAAAAVVALALRRRPLLACAVGAGFAALVLAAPSAPPAELGVRVLEGDARSGEWVEVRGAIDALEVPAGRLPWDDALEAGAPLAWVVRMEPGGGERWWLEGAGRWIYSIEPLDAAPRLDRGANAGPELARTWVRDAGGSWRAHGAWDSGEPLPPAVEGGGPPPGWLASGLPQGVGVLLGELAARPGAEGGTDRGWLRLVGF